MSEFARDPIRNNPIYGVGQFYADIATASYNNDWNSVAYSLSGATPKVGMTAAGASFGGKLAGSFAPNGISARFGGQFALATGGSFGNAVAVSFSAQQVASAAALTSGLAASSSVMFASRHDDGNYDYGKGKSFRGGSKSSRDNWY